MASYAEIYANVRELRDNIRRGEALAWQVLAHPEATANNIMYVHEQVVRNRAQYKEVYESMLKLGARQVGKYDPTNLKL